MMSASGVAIIVSALALKNTRKASIRANALANDANEIAKEAKTSAATANTIANQANSIAKKSHRWQIYNDTTYTPLKDSINALDNVAEYRTLIGRLQQNDADDFIRNIFMQLSAIEKECSRTDKDSNTIDTTWTQRFKAHQQKINNIVAYHASGSIDFATFKSQLATAFRELIEELEGKLAQQRDSMH